MAASITKEEIIGYYVLCDKSHKKQNLNAIKTPKVITDLQQIQKANKDTKWHRADAAGLTRGDCPCPGSPVPRNSKGLTSGHAIRKQTNQPRVNFLCTFSSGLLPSKPITPCRNHRRARYKTTGEGPYAPEAAELFKLANPKCVYPALSGPRKPKQRVSSTFSSGSFCLLTYLGASLVRPTAPNPRASPALPLGSGEWHRISSPETVSWSAGLVTPER